MTMVDPASLASEPLLAAIAWSYTAINSTRIVTYVPQIVAARRCTDGARAISLLTWGSWAVSHFSGTAYGTLVLHDAFFVAITTINLLGCCSVTAIVAAHRWRLRRRQPVAQTVPAGRGTPRHPPAWTGTARLLAAACAGALVAALWLQAPWEPAPPRPRPRRRWPPVDGRPAPAGRAARRRDPGPALRHAGPRHHPAGALRSRRGRDGAVRGHAGARPRMGPARDAALGPDPARGADVLPP